MTGSPRRILGLAFVTAIVAAACSGGTSTPGASHPPTCATKDLRLTYVQTAVDPTPHFVFVYGFENTGATACSMSGYPRLAVKKASGTEVAVPAEHLARWDYVTDVSLDPGKTAGFWFALGKMPCGAHNPVYVSSPGTSGTLIAPKRGYLKLACPGATVFLSPVHPDTAPPPNSHT